MAMQTNRPDLDAALARMSGESAGVQDSFSSLPQVLKPTEHVDVLATGSFLGKQGVLVLTNQRLFFWVQACGLDRTDEFPREQITAVNWSRGWSRGALTVTTGAGTSQFKGIDKQDGQLLDERLRSWITRSDGRAAGKDSQSPAPSVPMPAQTEVVAADSLPNSPPTSAAGTAWDAPDTPSTHPRPGGRFGRRRKQAEAEAARLAEEVRDAEARVAEEQAANEQLYKQLAALVSADAAHLAQEEQRLRRVYAQRVSEVESIDSVLDSKVADAAERAEALTVDAQRKLAQLESETQQAERKLHQARDELVATDDLLLLQSAGIYEFRHPLADAVAYKNELAELKDRYKTLARNGGAVRKATHWTVNGSLSEGRKMVRDFSKLMLRAYNAEADAAVRGMRPHRLASLVDRLTKSRETIARLGKTMQIEVTPEYHRLRVRELELTADYLAKQEEEKQRRRELREQQREEERLRREIERERARLEKERRHYLNAMQSLRTSGTADAAALAELGEKLDEIDAAVAAVDFREANVRAGYVYVISNIGAFGENMVKIGLTRRLDPMERVNELGDASVPFRFDVHALIFSEDAVGLERKLHQEFEGRKVNRVNLRREFFHVSPHEVRDALARYAGQHLLEFHEDADAPEWRASGRPSITPPQS
ncbi:DUF4041 domain-containing protein [Streptomyces sp. NPDC021622]|uniref:DUF4041 domain-containing protein n=1 Tax=Streptomyces sp. NPDC021622 TaxID=3155013 RepID=UPI0033F7CB30